MNKKLLSRRSSTPVPNTFAKRQTLQRRRMTSPGSLEVTWETLSNVSCSQNQESQERITKEPKLPVITTSQNGLKCQNFGQSKLDALGKTTLTGVRILTLPDNFCITAKPNLTSQRQNSVHRGESFSPQRQITWNKSRQEHCKALRQFITNAESTFDSIKEKEKILCNWMTSQTLLSS